MAKIKSIQYVGELQTYDLEVDHQDHQFYLDNGMLTSNSHSCLYSMTSYHTAWLKANYPVQFLLANLAAEDDSNALNAEDNISQIKDEIRRTGIEIVQPNLNISDRNYKVIDESYILTGFSSLKRLQDKAIDEIIAKRPFVSLIDFATRIDSSKVQLPTIQALIACGCFDDFGYSRKSLFLYYKDFRDKLQKFNNKKKSVGNFEYTFPKDDWTLSEKYALEVEYMGEAFVCSQAKAYEGFYGNSYVSTVSKIEKFEEREKIDSMKAIIKDMFIFRVKKEGSKLLGKEMAKLTLVDKEMTRFNATIFPDALDDIRRRKIILENDRGIFFSGTVNKYEGEFGVIIDNVFLTSDKPQLPQDRKSKKAITELKENKVKDSDNPLVNDLLDFISDIE